MLVKHNMEDGFKGGIEIPESIEIAKRIESFGVHGIVLSSGFVSKAPMAVMRGRIPTKTMGYYMPWTQWPQKIVVSLFGNQMIKQYDFEECFFLENALKFRRELKGPLVYVGGVVSREGIERVLDSGFEMVQMAACAGERSRVRRQDARGRYLHPFGLRPQGLLHRPNVLYRHAVLPQLRRSARCGQTRTQTQIDL